MKTKQKKKFWTPEEEENLYQQTLEHHNKVGSVAGVNGKICQLDCDVFKSLPFAYACWWKGVAQFGTGCWTQILKSYKFENRKPMDLKDKWRNILRPYKGDHSKVYERVNAIRAQLFSENQTVPETVLLDDQQMPGIFNTKDTVPLPQNNVKKRRKGQLWHVM